MLCHNAISTKFIKTFFVCVNCCRTCRALKLVVINVKNIFLKSLLYLTMQVHRVFWFYDVMFNQICISIFGILVHKFVIKLSSKAVISDSAR